MRGAFLTLFLIGAWFTTGISATAADLTNWRRYESAHFIFVSNTTQTEAQTLLQDLEAFRGVVENWLGPNAEDRAKTTIVGAASDEDFALIENPDGVGGFFIRSEEGDWITANLGAFRQSISTAFVGRSSASRIGPDRRQELPGNQTGKAILQHEYVHGIIANLSGPPVPLWFNEGMAEYFSTAVRRGNDIVVGIPLNGRTNELLNARKIPIDDLVNVEVQSDEYQNFEDNISYHAQAWLLAHYLSTSAERWDAVEAYLAARTGAQSESKALREALGEQLRRIERAAWGKTENRAFEKRRFTVGPADRHEVQDHGLLSPADLLCHIAILRGHRFGEDEARRSLNRALEEQDNNLCALTERAKLDARSGQIEAAEQTAAILQNLAIADADKALVNLEIAHARAVQASPSERPALIATARKAAEKAARYHPHFIAPHARLANLALLDHALEAETLAASQQAATQVRRLAPQQLRPILIEGELYLKAGNKSAAIENFKYVENWARTDGFRTFAAKRLKMLN